MIGQRLGHYQIVGQLGAGGMGEVYRAADTSLKRQVALKILPESLAARPERLQRFQREAESLAALDHPNIVTVFSVEQAEGIHFLTMQLVRGRPLSKLIPEGGMALEAFLELAIPLADALRAAHEKGIVHRDLKPENVMVDDGGRVMVLDFGLAKLRLPSAVGGSQLSTQAMTREGLVMGTARYMSPEQAQGLAVEQRSDIFSLGIVLYEMLCGRHPFTGENSASIISSILRDAPYPVADARPGLPARLVELLNRCLEKDPARRIQTAGALRDELRAVEREVSTGLPAVAEPATGTARPAARSTQVALLVAAVIVLTILAILVWQAGRTPAGPRITSLAVLPLQNLSGDPEQDYFAAGMTEALITDLSKIGALKVISRSSAMRYRGSEKPLAEIAAKLGVDAVVEGSVLREGDRVGITAQLIETRTDRNIWADRFERELTSILKLQGEIAQTIAREIEVTLTPGEVEKLSTAREVDPDTYQSYLKGMFFLNQSSPEGTQKGMAFLRDAVERSPDDPFAHAGLALGYAAIGHSPYGGAREFRQASEAAARALELDDSIAEAQLALGDVRVYYEWDFEGSGEAFERALELSPNLAAAHYHYGWYLELVGRPDEAEEHMARAKELDPLVPKYTAWLAGYYGWRGRLSEAIEEAHRALELAPDNPVGLLVLGGLYQNSNRPQEAVETHERLAEVAPGMGFGLAALAQSYALAGRTEDAKELIRRIESTPELQDGVGLALASVALGDHDRAIAWLEYSAQQREAFFPWIVRWPGLKVLRDDPRFQDLAARHELPGSSGQAARSVMGPQPERGAPRARVSA